MSAASLRLAHRAAVQRHVVVLQAHPQCAALGGAQCPRVGHVHEQGIGVSGAEGQLPGAPALVGAVVGQVEGARLRLGWR